MAVNRKMFRRLIGRIRRHESLTGRKISRNTFQSLMEAELTTTQARSQKTAEFEFRKEQFERTEERLGEEAKKAARGARLKGATSLTTAGISAAKTKTGQAIGAGARRIVGRVIPALTTTGGVGAGGAGTITYQGSTLYGADIAAGAPAAEAGLAGAGKAVLAKAAPVAATAVVSFIGAKIGEQIFRGEPKAGSIGGGALAGFLVGGPIGAIVGGITGAINAGTVICTELYVQGYIPIKILMLDSHDKHKDLNEKVYKGYMRWAPYVVKAMQKSRVVTWFIKPFGVGWAYHMAHKLDETIPDSWIGKVLYKIGVPVCHWLGREGK